MKFAHSKTVLETGVLKIEIIEDRCIVINKLSGNQAELRAEYDGFWTLHMQAERWVPSEDPS